MTLSDWQTGFLHGMEAACRPSGCIAPEEIRADINRLDAFNQGVLAAYAVGRFVPGLRP